MEGDVAAMRAQLDSSGAQERAEDRSVFYGAVVQRDERAPERAAAAAG